MKTKFFNANEQDLYFTSDLHLMHSKIIEHCSRPFKNSHEMNTALVENWNNKVPSTGIVFVTGDFCFGGKSNWRYFIHKLNGFIWMIPGNHDKSLVEPIEGKYDVHEGFMNIKVREEEFKHKEQYVTLCHYPMLSWYQSHRDSWQLHGHVHTGPNSTSKEKDLPYRRFQHDIGVDNNEFTPLSWQDIKDIMRKR
jgi:calcineurin-like phosphoesterase family protein